MEVHEGAGGAERSFASRPRVALKRKPMYTLEKVSPGGAFGVTLPDKLEEEKETLPMYWTISSCEAETSLIKFLKK